MPSSGPFVVSERQKLVYNLSHVVVVLLEELFIELAITEAHLHQAFMTRGGRSTRRPGYSVNYWSILWGEGGEQY